MNKTEMASTDILLQVQGSDGSRLPPGGIKIMQAMRELLQGRNFESITTAEISRVAGVNEALIYRYFKDKRGLLHKILAEYFKVHLAQIQSDVDEARSAINKLKTLIKGTDIIPQEKQCFLQDPLARSKKQSCLF